MKSASLLPTPGREHPGDVVPGGDQHRLQQLALGQPLAGLHRDHRRTRVGFFLDRLRLGRGDGHRETVIGAAQRVVLKGQVGGHHLRQAGDRGRPLVRAGRRAPVAEHERRLSTLRPRDRRRLCSTPGSALVEHAALVVDQAARCHEHRGD
jgi:hypothetical protein